MLIEVEVYHLEKSWLAGVGTLEILESGPLRVVLGISHPITPTSTLRQRIMISNGMQIDFDNDLDWHESHKILKVEFPLLLKSDFATFETQFGHLQRPTHGNSSWDLAKFEVCGHRWIDLSEFDYGVSLLNDCKYGFRVKDSMMHMSIIRSPKSPDNECDMGNHVFKYALLAHTGTFHSTIQRAHEFNCPVQLNLKHEVDILFAFDKPNIILDTIKLAQNSEDIVIRAYEAFGGRCSAKLSRYHYFDFSCKKIE